MVESTALEMRHTGNRIGGSNPSLSATTQNCAATRAFSLGCSESAAVALLAACSFRYALKADANPEHRHLSQWAIRDHSYRKKNSNLSRRQATMKSATDL